MCKTVCLTLISAICDVCVNKLLFSLLSQLFLCLGRDSLHPCEDGWSSQPQLWPFSLPLSFSLPQPKQEQQWISQLLPPAQQRFSVLLSPAFQITLSHLRHTRPEMNRQPAYMSSCRVMHTLSGQFPVFEFAVCLVCFSSYICSSAGVFL